MTCGCSEGIMMMGGAAKATATASSKSSLLERAKALKIKGASKMSKAELQSHCDAASKNTKAYWLSRAKDLKVKGAYKMTKEELRIAVLG